MKSAAASARGSEVSGSGSISVVRVDVMDVSSIALTLASSLVLCTASAARCAESIPYRKYGDNPDCAPSVLGSLRPVYKRKRSQKFANRFKAAVSPDSYFRFCETTGGAPPELDARCRNPSQSGFRFGTLSGVVEVLLLLLIASTCRAERWTSSSFGNSVRNVGNLVMIFFLIVRAAYSFLSDAIHTGTTFRASTCNTGTSQGHSMLTTFPVAACGPRNGEKSHTTREGFSFSNAKGTAAAKFVSFSFFVISSLFRDASLDAAPASATWNGIPSCFSFPASSWRPPISNTLCRAPCLESRSWSKTYTTWNGLFARAAISNPHAKLQLSITLLSRDIQYTTGPSPTGSPRPRSTRTRRGSHHTPCAGGTNGASTGAADGSPLDARTEVELIVLAERHVDN
mmetsp:Transcript_10574/g.39174  ORF Transcript_10574/g.39174 Transcript_10574/m.39174 type:complete len:399 (+) Transcript_10574:603-1799(+)